MSSKKSASKSRAKTVSRKLEGFTAEEKAAMKDRVSEMKAAARRRSGADNLDPDAEVLAKIAEMAPSDRAMGNRIHAIVKATAPSLTPRLWYGMPAYSKDDKVLCFFQSGQKFKTRYATLGFSDKSNLDDGDVWPVVFAIKQLTPDAEAKIAALLKKAIS